MIMSEISYSKRPKTGTNNTLYKIPYNPPPFVMMPSKPTQTDNIHIFIPPTIATYNYQHFTIPLV